MVANEKQNKEDYYYQAIGFNPLGEGPSDLDVVVKNEVVKTSSIGKAVFDWMAMALAIIAGASIGPVFKYMEQHDISACLACSWRCQCMCVFLIPLAFVEMYVHGSRGNKTSWFARIPELSYPLYVYIFIAGVAWAANLMLWIVGLQYTTTVRAAILESSHPLQLVCYMQFYLQLSVSRFEWIGVLLAIFGIIVVTFSDLTSLDQLNDKSALSWFGDTLCILSAVSEVVVILNRSQLKKHVPLMQYTAITTVLVTIISSICAVTLENSSLFCYQDDCLFGWMTARWRTQMLLFGLVVGVICITGFNYSMQQFSPLVFSAATLIDPAVTGIISWMAGIEGLPDASTVVGGLVVVAGVVFITVGELQREGTPPDHDAVHHCESIDNTQHHGVSSLGSSDSFLPGKSRSFELPLSTFSKSSGHSEESIRIALHSSDYGRSASVDDGNINIL